jgi:hypothetical protein
MRFSISFRRVHFTRAIGKPQAFRTSSGKAGEFWEALPVATRRPSSCQLADLGKKAVDSEPTGWQPVILKYV